MQVVPFYFDFVSPYSWLALANASTFSEEHGVCWDLRPVVYAKLLEACGLIGPAETEAKRRYTFLDVARCARELGLKAVGPPAHPFRSLEALRTAVLFRTEDRMLDLCVGIARACWQDGRDLADIGVLEHVVRGVGLEASDLERRLRSAEIKTELRRLTEEALEKGVFGVPTFVYDNELFWGHDRMRHLAERLAGRLPALGRSVEPLLRRPRAVVRKIH